ncbi:hypothetical protein QJS10_CPA01g02175 [Acorus calamus]|uniref:Sigma factor n=1 Tax=Acorus calamus TaxID=4465 RepID=A0AAV9FLW4_ACOCL|nr:hypothetical protein QJS10_CPA01g02175 [Acorus calamus]
MGVVSISSSVSRTPIGVSPRFLITHRRNLFLAFKSSDRTNNSALVTKEAKPTPIDGTKNHPKRLERAKKTPKRVKAVSIEAAPDCRTVDLDYDEVAAVLENIYKLSPGVVRNHRSKVKRLSLDKRVALKKKIKRGMDGGDELMGSRDIERLVREYSVSTDLVSLDWRKMKIPPVLPSSEHTWLFKLMQPMKAILEVKENIKKDLEREPTDAELADSVNMSVPQMRRLVEVGRATRNKLIKHNLRLILFVINKYYQDIASGPRFQDLCQAGVKGLITAIDRFEPKRGFRLSTYGLFWIRHAIIRSMTLSSFTRVSFGIETVRQEIQKAKLELLGELGRLPTEEEVISRVGISPERYHDVMRASRPVLSLHNKHAITQEEFIKGITDIDGAGGDKRRQPALLRLALDDVLDSLKPKESVVIRQRYGLDGKGDRTLGEIAGNLNISREMVRKHEVKALMKLKHPARADYLRRYVV